MKAARAWLIGALVLVAIAIGAFVTIRANRKPAIKYETVKVDQGRIVARVTATGTLSALVTVQVGSQVSGRISQILVDFNSVVKKGEVIAKIDPELFKAAIEQAKANYAAAKGNLEKAKAMAVDAERQFQRSAALAEKQLIATADRDTAESTAAAAKAQVAASQGALEQASASLHTAQVNLDYSIIKSPIDGVVISRSHRRRPNGGRVPFGAHAFHHCRRPRQDAGRHQRGRSRRGQALGRHAGDVHGRRVPAREISRQGSADSQLAAERAERHYVRRGHRSRQCRAEAQAGHDRQRDVHVLREKRRAARAERSLRFRPPADLAKSAASVAAALLQ